MLPDLPTVADFVPGYEASAWYGVGAPKDTPAEIIEQAQPGDQRDPRRSQGEGAASPSSAHRCLPGSPADFGKLIADETEKWGKVVKFSGAKPD